MRIRIWLLVTGCGLLLAACSIPGSVKPTVKIGLAAPFEGRYRDLGYEVLYAVRLAVYQRNEAGGVDDRYLVELVALNDFGDPAEAVLQAREMDVDPGVLGVIGGWSPDVAQAASPEYERLGLAFLSPAVALSDSLPLAHADDRFVHAYQQVSGGVAPGQAAAWAYGAANRLLDALEAAAQAEGTPNRPGVRSILSSD